MSTPWKPANMPVLTPALPGGRGLVEFMQKVFEASLVHVYETETGAMARADIRLGDSLVITGDPVEGRSTPPGSLHVYVPSCDSVYKRALQAGATGKNPPEDQFYGDRTARVIDPFGNQWSIATHLEDLTAGEMSLRAEQLAKG